MADTGSGNGTMNIPPSPGLERQSTRAPVEKKMSSKASNGSQLGSVRMKLKKVDEYEAKDAQMSAVFGVAPRDVKNTLKVNPLYDQYGEGVIEVSETDAKAAKSSKRSRSSNGDRSHRYSKTDPDEGEPKIAYGSNFMLGRGKEAENGDVNSGNDNRNKQLTTQGRVMPSRITRSVKQKSSSNSSNSQTSYNDPESPAPERSKVRRWRLIMLLILIVLILALALVLAIYFLTRDPAR